MEKYSVVLHCNMCGFKKEKEYRSAEALENAKVELCPKCLSENKHIDVEELEPWIKLKRVASKNTVDDPYVFDYK